MSLKKDEIERLIADAVSKAIDELDRKNLLRKSKMNAFQKTEQLLYNYDGFKRVIDDKQEEIEQIKEVGLSKMSMSIIPMPNENGSSKGVVSEEEKRNAAIAELEKQIATTKNVISMIEKALSTIQNDPYFEVIDMYYFRKMKYTAIMDEWKVEVNESTICRNKNRLVKQLSIYLFSDEYIKELYA